MFTPNREEFKNLAETGVAVPVYREVIVDAETPVSAFAKLAGARYAFLLESAEQGERFGRYSFLGINPKRVIEATGTTVLVRDAQGNVIESRENVEDPLSVVQEVVDSRKVAKLPGLPVFSGGAVGFLGYGAVRRYERLPDTHKNKDVTPDLVFMIVNELFVFDHLRHRVLIIVNASVSDDADADYDGAIHRIGELETVLFSSGREIKNLRSQGPSGTENDIAPVESNMSEAEFTRVVETAKEYILAGDILQVVLSQRFSVESDAKPFDIYRALRTINPAPYMYYLQLGDLCLAGSSPEPLVKVDGDSVLTRPIAGTRPRGRSIEEDEESGRELLVDEKERAEHVMLVDLGRNDLSKVCRPGSVNVEEFMHIENCSHVMHIVSTVTGKLREGCDAFDALRACFPAGTVSGAPKVRAMEIIEELEKVDRGPYAGVVGYVGYGGDMDVCITIRTIIISGRHATVQAGAGIVIDSDPASEYRETCHKARAQLAAIELAGANGGSLS